MAKRRKERRHPIACSHCGHEMVCMKKFELLGKQMKLYIWYICPRREGEGGCGATVLYEVATVKKTPQKVSLGKLRKAKSQ